MKTRMKPIESILPIINNYSIDFKQETIAYPNLNKYKIELFDLDSLRLEQKVIDNSGYKKEDIVNILNTKKIRLTKK